MVQQHNHMWGIASKSQAFVVPANWWTNLLTSLLNVARFRYVSGDILYIWKSWNLCYLHTKSRAKYLPGGCCAVFHSELKEGICFSPCQLPRVTLKALSCAGYRVSNTKLLSALNRSPKHIIQSNWYNSNRSLSKNKCVGQSLLRYVFWIKS